MVEEAVLVERYNWSRLNHLQVGRYGEYLAMMEFTLHGYDVYSAEVDDKGIDFVVRRGVDRFFDIQVKASRNFNYVFFRKDVFEPRDTLLAVVAVLIQGDAPELFLIPSTEWERGDGPLLVSRD